MKKCFLFFAVLCALVRVSAQTNVPVKLAIISETDEASPAADLLTVKLSGNDQIQLLERDQIEKIYREQSLSAANTDYLKLGHILGADGLLLLNLVRTPQTTNLMARLIAVKPGVILSDAGFNWPLKDTAQWSDSTAAYLNSFLPKLTVLLKDAIPISVVNLRSALNSTDASETERQLKLLVIQRLSQERQLFVLERQKMQLLSDEKELKADDSAFWDGSYLLEGVVDQNGYSPDIVTINARLTPPKGGAPVLFVASGSRTNLTEVINQLVVKVNGALKIQSTAPAWNAADEAAQFFKEANWALRWGAYTEAQSAADSAWALGKKDLKCAQVRVKAYVAEVTATTHGFQNGESTFSSTYDINGKLTGPSPTEADVKNWINSLAKENPFGLVYRLHQAGGAKIIDYSFAPQPPNPENIDAAAKALEIYYEISRTLPDAQPKMNSDWYHLGIGDLTAASKVLQDFNLVPSSQPPVADKLAELRASARSVAALISQSPSMHDSYFTGDRFVSRDELASTIGRETNIFRCEVQMGCFWQETPEDCVVLYRELMNSAAFSYIHTDFWLRDPQAPRLIAWNGNDRQRIPQVWNSFFNELENSTNALSRLEAQALTLADADSDQTMAEAFTNFFNGIFENAHVLMTNNVDELDSDWGAGTLVGALTGNGVNSATKDSLRQLFYSQYRQKFDGLNQATAKWRADKLQDAQFVPVFEKQKAYLKNNTPYVFLKFTDLFRARDYSQSQALELRSLAAAYQSNLIAEAASADVRQKGQLQSGIFFVNSLRNDLDRIIQPSGFESQKQYLKENRPFQFVELAEQFSRRDYTKNQALELQPLLAAYQSNLTVEAAAAGDQRKRELKSGSGLLRAVAKSLDLAINPPAPAPKPLPAARPTSQLVATVIRAGEPGMFVTNAAEPGAESITVDRFLEIPPAGLASDTTNILSQAAITGHLWFEGKLLLELEYQAEINWFDEKGNWQGGRDTTLPAIAILDLTNLQWKVIGCPEVDFASQNNFYHRSAIWHGELFDSDGKQIRKYDFQNQRWLTLPVSDGNNYELFVVNDRLYAANRNIMFEIIDGGNSSHILTSTRRQPPASILDAQDFGTPTLFEGPDHSLRVYAAGKIFTWVGNDWREDSTAPPVSFLPEVFPDGIICRQFDGFSGTASLSTLATGATTSELCLWQKRGHIFGRADKPASPPSSPLWQMPEKLEFSGLSAVLKASNLYLLADATNAPENKLSHERNESTLLYFSRGLPKPQELLLKFENAAGLPPPAWLFPVADTLFFGNERPRNYMYGGGNYYYPRGKSGVWLLPLSRIEPAIAAQKQIQHTQLIQAAAAAAQAAAAVEQAQKDRFAKYDLNHNGVIDPDEKEAALDDPAFVTWQWDLIDTNQNGQLDLEELTYFDANRNKILEPKEQAGIEIAQHLLAERDLQKFDADEDGALKEQEFGQLLSGLGSVKNYAFASTFYAADANHDRKIDLSELETYLQQQLHRKIRPRGPVGSAFYEMQMQRGKTVDAKELFKEELETYWQNPGSVTNLPSLNHRHQVEQPLLMPQ